MDRLERLEAIEAIRNLKARYFRLMDTKQWDALADVFTPDMRVVTPDGRIWMEGGEKYAASLQFGLSDAVSCHQGLTGEIEIAGDGTATGIWAMQDVITWTDRHPREGWKAILGRGHYHETYRRGDDGQWRIATLTLTRLSLDITLPDDNGPEGHHSA
jgi:ketosteroid isomerase-like protein